MFPDRNGSVVCSSWPCERKKKCESMIVLVEFSHVVLDAINSDYVDCRGCRSVSWPSTRKTHGPFHRHPMTLLVGSLCCSVPGYCVGAPKSGYLRSGLRRTDVYETALSLPCWGLRLGSFLPDLVVLKRLETFLKGSSQLFQTRSLLEHDLYSCVCGPPLSLSSISHRRVL